MCWRDFFWRKGLFNCSLGKVPLYDVQKKSGWMNDDFLCWSLGQYAVVHNLTWCDLPESFTALNPYRISAFSATRRDNWTLPVNVSFTIINAATSFDANVRGNKLRCECPSHRLLHRTLLPPKCGPPMQCVEKVGIGHMAWLYPRGSLNFGYVKKYKRMKRKGQKGTTA